MTIRVEIDGETLTLLEVAKKYNIPRNRVYKRYSRGLDLFLPKMKVGRKSLSEISECKTKKTCVNCKEMKSIKEFHKHKQGVLGVTSTCKICRNRKVYQKELEKEFNSGNKSITNCSDCGDFMRRKIFTEKCRRCNE